MIRYYIADIRKLADPKIYPDLFEGLPRERQDKCLWYVRPKDRKRCLGAGRIIEKILSDFNVTSKLTYGENGKPECEDVCFNISHSGNFVIGVAALKENVREIGCDIEYMDNAPLEVADKYFFNSEKEYIQKSENPSLAFWKLWTLKESYMKMTGEGMSLPLDSFEVVCDDLSVYRQGVRQDCGLRHFVYEGHSIGICFI